MFLALGKLCLSLPGACFLELFLVSLSICTRQPAFPASCLRGVQDLCFLWGPRAVFSPAPVGVGCTGMWQSEDAFQFALVFRRTNHMPTCLSSVRRETGLPCFPWQALFFLQRDTCFLPLAPLRTRSSSMVCLLACFSASNYGNSQLYSGSPGLISTLLMHLQVSHSRANPSAVG